VRYLVVNADDLGHSAAVNEGISVAHERGIVTSASLMVLRAAAPEAAAYARSVPALSVGLHVDLGEWTYRDGAWEALYETPAAEIPTALEEQLRAFRSLLGTDPTHLDSHQHVHLREPAGAELTRLALELDVPLRHLDPRVRYCGDFYGQTQTGDSLPDRITAEALVTLIEALPAGLTELCCHPGQGHVPDSSYSSERGRELAALCDPRVRAAIDVAGVQLVSFRDVA
jgi:predicted glycoside hydrolase/deacetylase ChbG (UPF0249 family)